MFLNWSFCDQTVSAPNVWFENQMDSIYYFCLTRYFQCSSASIKIRAQMIIFYTTQRKVWGFTKAQKSAWESSAQDLALPTTYYKEEQISWVKTKHGPDSEKYERMKTWSCGQRPAWRRSGRPGKTKGRCRKLEMMDDTMTIYEVNLSQVKRLERIMNAQIRKWLGLPRCVTLGVL